MDGDGVDAAIERLCELVAQNAGSGLMTHEMVILAATIRRRLNARRLRVQQERE